MNSCPFCFIRVARAAEKIRATKRRARATERTVKVTDSKARATERNQSDG
ncbi:hypothetical protein [Lysinibacillus sp. NPDC056232]